MTSPTPQTPAEMLAEWQGAAERALEGMLADLRAGKLIDDTLPADMDHLRHLMGRREVIVHEILLRSQRHRGPGTPLYRQLERD